MDHLDPTPSAAKEKDPVCGMDVNPATARFKALHNENEYFFCGAGCMAKFQANPEQILSAPPKPMSIAKPMTMTSGLVSLGNPADSSKDSPKGSSKMVMPTLLPTMTQPAAAVKAPLPDVSAKDTRAYVCPMCPEVRQIGAGPCPKCGMALEPRTVTIEEDNPELRDMTRRFWISLTLTAPLLAIAMGSMLWPHAFTASPWNWGLPWLELLLSTPVVLWGGWPFFQRGWASVVNRSTNMFTLIAMGTGVAYLFSVVATLFPRIFPASFRSMGDRPDVYFEAAAAIVTLVLLGQVLELQARSRTSSAIRALLDLSPKMARVILPSEDGSESDRDIPLEQVK